MGLFQHTPGVFGKAGRDGVGLPGLEKQQVFALAGLIKGIIHLPFPGHPVKVFRGLHREAACVRAVAYELFHALLAVGLLVGLPFFLDLPPCRPESEGQRPGRQLAAIDDQRDCAPGNIFFNQLYHLLSILHKI